MDTINEIAIDEVTLDKAYKMLDKLRRHYLRKARDCEIHQPPEWEHKAAKYESKAEEVRQVMDAFDEAQGY